MSDSFHFELDENGLPVRVDQIDSTPVLSINEKILSEISSATGAESGFRSAFQVLKRHFPDQFESLSFESIDLEYAKDRARQYFVDGPAAFFEGLLVPRAWVFGIDHALNRGGKNLFHLKFAHLEENITPRWGMELGEDAKPVGANSKNGSP